MFRAFRAGTIAAETESARAPHRNGEEHLMYAILECPDGPALCVGYRTLEAAVAALDRLRSDDVRYASHVVAATADDTGGAG